MTRLFTNDATKLFLFAIGAFLLAAALTPIVHNIGQFLADVTADKSINPIIDYVGKHARKADFPRYFNRSLYLSVIILFPFLILTLRARNPVPLARGKTPWSFALPARTIACEAGQPLRKPDSRLRQFLGGFLLGAGFLFLTGWLLLQLNLFTWNGSDHTAKLLQTSLTTGLIVSVIEEFIFRGVLLGLFLRSLRPLIAITLLSLLFALLHFLQPPDGLTVSNPDSWTAGFEFLGLVAARFLSPQSLVAEFLTLFAAGTLLASARYATSALWLPIGLHAGWVFALQSFNGLTHRTPDLSSWKQPLVGDQLTQGIIPLAALGLTGLLLWLTYRKADQPRLLTPNDPANPTQKNPHSPPS